jgi:hypothetical protein
VSQDWDRRLIDGLGEQARAALRDIAVGRDEQVDRDIAERLVSLGLAFRYEQGRRYATVPDVALRALSG